jgi:hypothetical protein
MNVENSLKDDYKLVKQYFDHVGTGTFLVSHIIHSDTIRIFCFLTLSLALSH